MISQGEHNIDVCGIKTFVKEYMLSNAAIYGIRGLIYLASKKERKYIPISEISEKLDISFHFLTKIFQKFTK